MQDQPANQAQNKNQLCEICERPSPDDPSHNPLCKHIRALTAQMAELRTRTVAASIPSPQDEETKPAHAPSPSQSSDESLQHATGPGLEK